MGSSRANLGKSRPWARARPEFCKALSQSSCSSCHWFCHHRTHSPNSDRHFPCPARFCLPQNATTCQYWHKWVNRGDFVQGSSRNFWRKEWACYERREAWWDHWRNGKGFWRRSEEWSGRLGGFFSFWKRSWMAEWGSASCWNSTTWSWWRGFVWFMFITAN